MKKSRGARLVQAIRDAAGAKPGDTITIITPQFTREPGAPSPAAPPADFAALRGMGKVALRELGLRPWGLPEDDHGRPVRGRGMLYLFPGEWYNSIPAGFLVTDLWYEEEPFVPGQTDDDIRFGCLVFGVVGPE